MKIHRVERERFLNKLIARISMRSIILSIDWKHKFHVPRNWSQSPEHRVIYSLISTAASLPSPSSTLQWRGIPTKHLPCFLLLINRDMSSPLQTLPLLCSNSFANILLLRVSSLAVGKVSLFLSNYFMFLQIITWGSFHENVDFLSSIG